MTRETTPLLLADLSRFARNLGKALTERQLDSLAPPGHKADCSAYWKLPARPGDEVRALLTAWRARAAAGA